MEETENQDLNRMEFVHSDFTYAEVSMRLPNGEVVVASGFAKRDPIDKPDFELAQMLANARAFEVLSRKLFRRANGLVKHHDDMRAAKEQLKALQDKKMKRASRAAAKKLKLDESIELVTE